jgi:hypothetical protein
VFKVMTWNVENLFRPGSADGPTAGAVYQQKLQGLADMINGQAADALSVQEIGDPAALGDLVASPFTRPSFVAHNRLRPSNVEQFDGATNGLLPVWSALRQNRTRQ